MNHHPYLLVMTITHVGSDFVLTDREGRVVATSPSPRRLCALAWSKGVFALEHCYDLRHLDNDTTR